MSIFSKDVVVIFFVVDVYKPYGPLMKINAAAKNLFRVGGFPGPAWTPVW